MNSSATCMICQGTTHKAENCPTLCEPLKPGFATSPPGGGHGGGEDDEKIDEKRA